MWLLFDRLRFKPSLLKGLTPSHKDQNESKIDNTIHTSSFRDSQPVTRIFNRLTNESALCSDAFHQLANDLVIGVHLAFWLKERGRILRPIDGVIRVVEQIVVLFSKGPAGGNITSANRVVSLR